MFRHETSYHVVKMRLYWLPETDQTITLLDFYTWFFTLSYYLWIIDFNDIVFQLSLYLENTKQWQLS